MHCRVRSLSLAGFSSELLSAILGDALIRGLREMLHCPFIGCCTISLGVIRPSGPKNETERPRKKRKNLLFR